MNGQRACCVNYIDIEHCSAAIGGFYTIDTWAHVVGLPPRPVPAEGRRALPYIEPVRKGPRAPPPPPHIWNYRVSEIKLSGITSCTIRHILPQLTPTTPSRTGHWHGTVKLYHPFYRPEYFPVVIFKCSFEDGAEANAKWILPCQLEFVICLRRRRGVVSGKRQRRGIT